MGECKIWSSCFIIIASFLFLIAWTIACIIVMTGSSSNYHWYKNAIDTNATVKSNWINNDTYRDVCDSHCVNGCAYCTFPCYNGGVVYEYFDTNNRSYTFGETPYNCISYNRVVADLEACCGIGKTIPLWYNKSNPRDYRKVYEPTNFIRFAIAYPIVFVVVLVILILACIRNCQNGCCSCLDKCSCFDNCLYW